MLTEQYCNFDTARLLKEKGFDGEWTDIYVENPDSTNRAIYPKITQSMAMKYLRERYKLNIIISVDDLDWFYSIIDYTHKGDVKLLKDLAGFNSFENAADAAILECLTNLI